MSSGTFAASCMRLMRRYAVAAGSPEAGAAYAEAVKLLDRAGRKRLIHPNTAARQKSRLAKLAAKK